MQEQPTKTPKKSLVREMLTNLQSFTENYNRPSTRRLDCLSELCFYNDLWTYICVRDHGKEWPISKPNVDKELVQSQHN